MQCIKCKTEGTETNPIFTWNDPQTKIDFHMCADCVFSPKKKKDHEQ